MSIEQLAKVVSPPESPLHAGPVTKRSAVEAKLGLALPGEFYELALTYGSGSFGNQLEVYNPFSPSYVDCIKEVCDVYRDLKEDEGDEFIPYDIYPSTPGLLPWADEANGHILFWLTEGDPERWPIILFRCRAAEFERWDMSMSDFLTKVFSAQIHCILWDEQGHRDLLGIRFHATAE